MMQMNLFKHGNWVTNVEKKPMVTKGEREVRGKSGDWGWYIHTTINKTDNW